MKTGMVVFPYGMRVYNCMAVSDQPLSLQKSKWRELLLGIRIHGEPALDLEKEYDRGRLDELLELVDSVTEQPPSREGLETRDSMLARFGAAARVITDDNMIPEWKDPLSEQLAR